MTDITLYLDYATGETNVNRPKEHKIEVHDIRKFDPQVCAFKPNGLKPVSAYPFTFLPLVKTFNPI